MRKFIAILLTVVLAMGCLGGCGSSGGSAGTGTSTDTSADTGADADTQSLSIVATIFPEYDWAREILGDVDAELTLLIGDGVDLHSYQPTVEDILTISTCDLFIYVGGESDEWVEDALAEATNEDMIVLNLLEILGDAVVEEELVEGMEAEEEEEEDEDEDDEEEVEYDEHVWLSLKHAQTICEAITEAICQLDEGNTSTYEANNASYQQQLEALDEKCASACAAAAQTTLLFADRFPFRYLVDDYGLSYYAAFVGCSAETEASFETIVFLAQKVDELGLSTVLIIESSDGAIAKTVIANTASGDQQVLVLNSMQAVTTEDIEAGVTYLSLAEENLEVLKEALK